MKKIILLIVDGLGLRQNETGNAIKMANLPNIKRIFEKYSVSELSADGEEAGLPKGINGNCEVGHITLGTGRIIKSPLNIINDSIKDKSFFENDVLLDVMDHVNENKSTLHLVGLLSDSFVNSSMDHFYACLALAKIRKVKNVVFHFITDGRDTNTSAKDLLDAFMVKIAKLSLGEVGTICGRYYAMDNENNYDRVSKAYDVMVHNAGNTFSDYKRCLDLHYKNGIDDEFVNPSIISKGSNIKDNDAVLFVNYRPERMGELISSFTDPSFNMFNVKPLKNVKYTVLYGDNEKVDSAYSTEPINNTMGSYLADLGFKQVRIAEAIKFPHVTYFFDGCEELKDKNLYRILIPSAKVARFDMKPEMNTLDVTRAVLQSMEDDFDFIVANYANPDMLGHSGNIPASVRALEACDVCIEKILEKAEENFYDLVITSDHGNVEFMKDSDGTINKANTDSKVPLIICNQDIKLKETGTLKDVIPTIIDLYEISKPKEMTGESLIIKSNG